LSQAGRGTNKSDKSNTQEFSKVEKAKGQKNGKKQARRTQAWKNVNGGNVEGEGGRWHWGWSLHKLGRHETKGGGRGRPNFANGEG